MFRRLARLALPVLLAPLAIGLAACGGSDGHGGSPLSQPVVNQPPLSPVAQPSTPPSTPPSSQPTAQPSPQPSGLSKNQFIAAADQICGQANQQLDALGRPDESDPQAIAEFLQQAVQIKQAEETQIAGLGFPPADNALLTDLMNRSHAGLDTVNRAADQFAAGDVAGGNQTLESVQSESDSLNSELQSYGFQVCGQG